MLSFWLEPRLRIRCIGLILLLFSHALAQIPSPTLSDTPASPTPAFVSPDNTNPLASQFFYNPSVGQGDVWRLQATNLAPSEEVIIVMSSPDAEVTVLRQRATLLGTLQVQYRFEAAGLWALDVVAAQRQERLQVRVEAATQTSQAAATLNLEQGVLQSRDSAGTSNWRVAFPEDSGLSSHFVQEGETLYLAHGNSVLQVEAGTGKIQQRWLLPNQVLQLQTAGAGGILASFALDGREQQALIEQGVLQQALPFADNAALFNWLSNEAKVADALTRVQQDSSNPWLYAHLAEQSRDTSEALELWQHAIDKANSFYSLNRLSQRLYQAGFYELATESFDKAMQDFLARGYDPRLLTSLEYVQRYHFPYAALQHALAVPTAPDAPDARRFWAERLWWAAPYLPEAKALYQDYSQQLSAEGRQDQARLWASRAVPQDSMLEFRATSLQTWLWRLARVNWAFVIAMLISLTLLALVLSQKYQAMQLQQSGWGLRFWHLFERISLWLGWLLVGAVVIVLSYWQVSTTLPEQVGTGRWASAALANYPEVAARNHDSSDVLAYAQRYKVEAPAIVRFADVQQASLLDVQTWWQQVRSQPLALLEQLRPAGWSLWVWRGLCAFYAFMLLLLLIGIFLPRPQGSNYSARPWLFYLLALLIPGSALCNVLWGGALLSIWTVLAYDYVMQWLNGSSWVNLNMPTFGIASRWLAWGMLAIYALNTLMVWLESSLHRRVRRKVTRPLLTTGARLPQKSPALAGSKANPESESRLPSGNYHVMRADEPQSWD